jgi:hypothetical protein
MYNEYKCLDTITSLHTDGTSLDIEPSRPSADQPAIFRKFFEGCRRTWYDILDVHSIVRLMGDLHLAFSISGTLSTG